MLLNLQLLHQIEYETKRYDIQIFMLSHLCGWASFILIDICRPGSVPPSSAFFNEFTGLFEILATFQLSVTITGDLNIHLQKLDDADAVRLHVLSSFDLLQHVSSPTHDRSSLFDVIIASGDHPPEDVSVIEVGLSDHMLLS